MKKLILIFLLLFSLNAYSVDLYHEYNVDLPGVSKYSSPTERFIQINSIHSINTILNQYGASPGNISMFKQMIKNESAGFFGYHGGRNEYRIFQDVIRLAIEVYLEIPIRENFHFLRTPGISDYSFNSANDFLKKYPTYHDDQPHIRKHILSINTTLYNSWDATWDFTPRYFLENQSWTYVDYQYELIPFFKKLGVDPSTISGIFQEARKHFTSNKGFIIQFFDSSHSLNKTSPYSFLNKQAFIGGSGSKSSDSPPSTCYINASYYFPQLRMVMNNKHTLNPNSPIIMLRYATIPPEKQVIYEEALKNYMRALPYDQSQADAFREELINCWQ